MAKIDIDGLDEAALIELHDQIVDRLHLLHRQKTAQALRQIKIGDRVMFEGPDNTLISGIVIPAQAQLVAPQSQDGEHSRR